MPCTHEIHEMDTAAVADGLCPLCLADEREAVAKASFDAGWNFALEEAAKLAESYPEGWGEEYVAFGLIGKGQDDAARQIAEAIRMLADKR